MISTGWITPPPIYPREVTTRLSLWLVLSMALSAATAWLALSQTFFREQVAGSGYIVLFVVLWLGSGLILRRFVPRFTALMAFSVLVTMSLLTGLLSASIFPLHAALLAFGLTGGMYASGAVLARFTSGKRYYFLLLVSGVGLSILVNIVTHSSGWRWVGTSAFLLLFLLASASKSAEVQADARSLYARDYVTTQSCALRGALTVWLGLITMLVDLLRVLVDWLSSMTHGGSLH
ncbi:Bax inhibitor-1 family protein [Phytobacter sp. AG2a]